MTIPPVRLCADRSERSLFVRRRDKRRRGGTMLEGALSFLVFLMFLLGIIDFSRLVWTYNTMAFGARQGTRYASVRGSSSGNPATATTISTYVQTQIIGITTTSVSTTWTPNNSPGSTVQVTVQDIFSSLIPWIPASISVQSRSQLIVVQ